MKNIRYIDGRGFHRIIQPQDPDFPPVFADAGEFELAKVLEAPHHEKFQLVRVFPLDLAPDTEQVDETIARWATQYGHALLEKIMLLTWTNHMNSLVLPASPRVRSMHCWLVPADRPTPSTAPSFSHYGISFWYLPKT
jgi:hypothetical protein